MSLMSSDIKLGQDVDPTVRRWQAASTRDLEQLYLLLTQGLGGFSNQSPGAISQDVNTNGMGVEANQGDYTFSGPASLAQAAALAGGIDTSVFLQKSNNLSDVTNAAQSLNHLGSFPVSYTGWNVITNYGTVGSFTHTFNVNAKAVVYVIQAGGGGGGGAGVNTAGGGGSSGERLTVISNAPTTATAAIVVGAGGAGGAAGVTGSVPGATSVVVNGITVTPQAGGGGGGGTAGLFSGYGGSGQGTGTQPTTAGYMLFSKPGESGQAGFVSFAYLTGATLNVVGQGGQGGTGTTSGGEGGRGGNTPSNVGLVGGQGVITIYEAV